MESRHVTTEHSVGVHQRIHDLALELLVAIERQVVHDKHLARSRLVVVRQRDEEVVVIGVDHLEGKREDKLQQLLDFNSPAPSRCRTCKGAGPRNWRRSHANGNGAPPACATLSPPAGVHVAL